MAHGSSEAAKAAHVNLSTDTIIKNLPIEGLRSVMRGILVAEPAFTDVFVQQSKKYLEKVKTSATPQLFDVSGSVPKAMSGLYLLQGRIRAMLGCGLAFDALDSLRKIVDEAAPFVVDDDTPEGEALEDILAIVDSDIIAAVTAAQKELITASGTRSLSPEETASWDGLVAALLTARKKALAQQAEFMFERGASAMAQGL